MRSDIVYKVTCCMSVAELARAFMVPSGSALWTMLEGGVLTPNRAAECLGRSVHVGVALTITRLLQQRGIVYKGMTYGSA